jgi:tryptophan halogenase
MRNIVVVGAGFAGWATALYMKKLFSECNVTVIGSKEIGILGAGEGTVPSFKDFIKNIDIDPNDLVRNCKATLKYGIRFDGWDQNGSGSYYNSFKLKNSTNPEFEKFNFNLNIIDLYCKINNLDIHEYSFPYSHLKENKVLYKKQKNNVTQKFYNSVNHAYHFDANDIAEYLQEIAIARKIQYVDDIVTEFIQNEDGDIVKIKTKNQEVDADFVFDCTGFKRLIIGKLYNSKFVSAKDRLLVNRSIPFILPPKDDIEPYTTATAMKYGWCWKIPLQHRYGCGYVFNDNLCSIEDAQKEIREKFGDVDMPRTISFEAGYYEEPWIKNCIAVGLSNSFVEPLEATSIWFSLTALTTIINYLPALINRNQFIIDEFNKTHRESNEIIIDNIQFHYLNKRNDTEFWRTMNSLNKSEKLQKLITVWDNSVSGMLSEEIKIYAQSAVFWDHSWFHIGLGINFFNNDVLTRTFNTYSKYYCNVLDEIDNLKRDVQVELQTSLTHSEYIEHLVGEGNFREIKKSLFK